MAEGLYSTGGAPTSGVVNIGKWSFGIREVVLAVVAAILLILFPVFAGLYGQALREQASSEPKDQRYCTTTSCLKIAAHVNSLMNKSVDPCENFFQYACGNYDNVKPFNPRKKGIRTILDDIKNLDEDRFIKYLEEPVNWTSDHFAVRKVKVFFKSCSDMDTKEKLKGLPFLTRIIPIMGGWSVIGTLNASTWNFQEIMKNGIINYIDRPFYHFRRLESTGRYLTLTPGGVSRNLPLSSYIRNDSDAVKVREGYKTFMRTVGTLLARDAHELMNPPLGDASARKTLVDNFVNDVIAVETEIAKAVYDLNYTEDLMSLAELTSYSGGAIDFVDQLCTYFQLAGFTAQTKVMVVRKEYFRQLSDLINSLAADKKNRARMLNNYFVGRVGENLAEDLSMEYLHADQQLDQVLYGPQFFTSVYRYCYYVSLWYFGDVLSVLYVQEFFDKENKDKIADITSRLQKTLMSQIDNMTWFDEVTKRHAKEKLDAVHFMLGFPDRLESMAGIDASYTGLSFDISRGFDNAITMAAYDQSLWNQLVIDRARYRDYRNYYYFFPRVRNDLSYNTIFAMAGALQFPIFDKILPHYYAYGSIGSMLGLYLHHVIDINSGLYDKDGFHLATSWWTKQSETNFGHVKQCVDELLKNVLLKLSPRPRNGRLARKDEFIPFVNGIRLARKAYVDLMASPDWVAEKMLPGVDLNEEQMFYLAHIQAHCQSASHEIKSNYENVNSFALGQLPEFSKAFNCKRGSKMNPAKRCDYN